jgi:hypothetical protein
MDSTQPHAPADQVADWLLAEYDATSNPFAEPDDEHSGVLWRGVYVQPILMFKNVLDAGKEMRICARDYTEPGRRFL